MAKYVNGITQEMLDDLSPMTEEEMAASDRELGLGMLETVQNQLEAGFIDAAKTTLKCAIKRLGK